MRNWSISDRVTVTAGLILALAVTVTPALAQAPVVEPRPAVERPVAPLIVPPGTQQPQQQRQQQPQPGPGAQGRVREPVVETVPFRPPVLDSDDGEARPQVPGDLAEVVLQLQQLQQEVMMLRGLVEAQQHSITRLEREQRERYLDLDRRLSRGGAPAASDPLTDPHAPLDTGPVGEAAADERRAYEEAFGLTREREFETAITHFHQLVADFPGGAYEGNAWYWLGELYLALSEPELEDSRAAFVQVIERWPEHHKVPDALYKLGVVYHQLGEPDTARDYLERVREEHAGSSAARLATGYLERL